MLPEFHKEITGTVIGHDKSWVQVKPDSSEFSDKYSYFLNVRGLCKRLNLKFIDTEIIKEVFKIGDTVNFYSTMYSYHHVKEGDIIHCRLSKRFDYTDLRNKYLNLFYEREDEEKFETEEFKSFMNGVGI